MFSKRHKDIFQRRKMSWILKHIYYLWRKTHRSPRQWSNDELLKFSHLFCGDVINVSAGIDSDKRGKTYRQYFYRAKSYSISNYKGGGIKLDLSDPLLDTEVLHGFDVVFSHTVLEHIYKFKIAVRNLCQMSKDIIITVVPFLQAYHNYQLRNYQDFWRFSPHALINLFDEYGFKTIYMNWNNDPISNIYLFHIASKHPERWDSIIEQNDKQFYGPGYYRQLLLDNSKDCNNAKITELKC